MNEWGDKEADVDGWHRRGHPGPHRGRMHGKIWNTIFINIVLIFQFCFQVLSITIIWKVRSLMN